MGLTRQQAERLGLGHLFPTESKPLPIAPPPAPTRAPSDGMNKLERAFWERASARFGGRHVHREGLTVRLAGRTRYTPDFFIVPDDAYRYELYEIKGFMRDDAAVKLKVAAEMYPCFSFYLVTREKGRWACRQVTPRGISREVFTPEWLR